MKGILISSCAAIIMIVITMILYFLLRSCSKRFLRLSHKKQFGCMFAIWLVLFFSGAVLYFNQYYKSGETAAWYLASHDEVVVSSYDKGYFFDGKGEEDALIFYPGAKVAASAYAPLMFQLAQNGVDCFLVEMPFHMAFFGIEKATDIMSKNQYENWYLSGHSLGGAIAASYVTKHPDVLDGLILLASYPTKKLPDELRMLSVYGSLDGVMNRSAYEEGKQYWPKNSIEIMIEGGNHAQFADYGMQKGDGEAAVSAEEQQAQTLHAMLEMIQQDEEIR